MYTQSVCLQNVIPTQTGPLARLNFDLRLIVQSLTMPRLLKAKLKTFKFL